MRKIEQQMNEAIRAFQNVKTWDSLSWSSGNTSVTRQPDGFIDVYLHGNHIAQIGDRLLVSLPTLRRWPSMTTRSRLRALGADLVSIKGVLHLNGKSIYAE